MPPTPLNLAVIVRTCGRSPLFLRRALNSIISQTVLPTLIVVVDDSADGAKTEVELAKIDFRGIRLEFLPRDLRSQFQPNRSSALNRGIVSADTRWVSFLDDDDTWLPDFVEKMTYVIANEEQAEDWSGVVCRTEAVYERFSDGRLYEVGREPFNPDFLEVRVDLLVRENLFTINAAIWKEMIFSKIGGFREDLSVMEDWEFNVRAARKFRMKVLPEYLVRYHRRLGGGAAANSSTKEHDRVMDELQREWRIGGLLNPGKSKFYDLLENWILRMQRRRGRFAFWLRWGRRH